MFWESAGNKQKRITKTGRKELVPEIVLLSVKFPRARGFPHRVGEMGQKGYICDLSGNRPRNHKKVV